MDKFKNHVKDNFIDETILGTPVPQATSTVNSNDRYFSYPSPPSKLKTKPRLSSRLTGTIENVKSFSEALASVGRTSIGQNHSLLSITDASFEHRIPSKASLGVLDIDTLLANETLDNSQEIMEQLYRSHQRKGKSPGKNTDKNVSSCALQGKATGGPAPSKFSGNPPNQAENNTSVLGVPSFLLKADNTMSEADSFSEVSSICESKYVSLGEASAEVAAIMDKDSSFDSGRISFEPREVSARSTSLGGSSSDSKASDYREFLRWSNVDDNTAKDEVFISGEDGLLEMLEKDEKSFAANQLPPIMHDMIPDRNMSLLSVFSEVHDGEKIMVRPSWIGMDGESDDPINISVGQYFRMKADVMPAESENVAPEMRPNFGMKIVSPKRNRKRIPPVAESLDVSTSQSTQKSWGEDLNATKVITPKNSSQSPGRNNEENGESSPEVGDFSSIMIPSISRINEILKEINENDSPNTMANKFLRHPCSSSSKEQRNIQEHSGDTTPVKNVMEKNFNDNIQVKDLKKKGLRTPRIDLNDVSSDQVKVEEKKYVRNSTRANEPKNVIHEIPDLVKKLNSIERRGKNGGGALRNVTNLVDKLKINVAGPLDCSALYETLGNDGIIEGSLDSGERSISPSEVRVEAVFAEELTLAKCWVEIPKELLISGCANELQQQLCVGLGFSAYVPIVNVTNKWLMYQVSPNKSSSNGNVSFQQLPMKTLLAPGSHAEFEIIVVPMSAGRHSIDLEIEVTNFMTEGDASAVQKYLSRLILNSAVPKVVVLSDSMNELKDKDTLNFGVLPEECSKILPVHILNAGGSDIPIRIVIEEMPEAFQPFQICNASRSPLTHGDTSGDPGTDKLSQCGINLERKDLLSCDLSGSGSKAMVTVGLSFKSPRINKSSGKVKSELFSASLRVELDVPMNCVSEFTVLKKVFLVGQVGVTRLKVGVESDPLILSSKGKISQSQSNSGRGTASKEPNFQEPVTQQVPVSNLGATVLDITVSILLPSGEKTKDDDAMKVVPDRLNVAPGGKCSVCVSYHPRTNELSECNRILTLRLNPNGPTYSYKLKGVPIQREIGNSLLPNSMRKIIGPVKGRLPEPVHSLWSATHIIQSTHTTLVWGCVPVTGNYIKSVFCVKNPTEILEKVTMAVTGSENYKLLSRELDMVGKLSFELHPGQIKALQVFFRPKKFGPSVGKLEISVFDGRQPERKIAHKMMSLCGYGGSCKIEVIALPKDLSGRPWLNLGLVCPHPTASGSLDLSMLSRRNLSRSPSPSHSAPSVKSRLLIHNAGVLAAFVKIIPLALGVDPESLTDLEEGREHCVTVRPDVFQLEPLTAKNVWVTYVHGLGSNPVLQESSGELTQKGSGERALEEIGKLLILSGEVATRARLRKIYKTSEIIHVNKDLSQLLDLSGIFSSFIGVSSSEGIIPEFEEYPNGDEGEEHVSALCDPTTKDAVKSLLQNMKSLEVLLAVEKEIGVIGPENDANATLALTAGGNEEVFQPLMDDKDASPTTILCESFPNPQDITTNSDSGEKSWSVEPQGTLYLGAEYGLSSSIVLRSHTSDIIIFEIRLGLIGVDGTMKWLPPSHRHAQISSSLLMVEPWQGQLLPYESTQVKVFLLRDSQYPSLNGVLQIYSENDCLKVNVKVRGSSYRPVPKS